jgi:hypothetical protein
MIIKTRVFELCRGRYRSLAEMADAMGLSVSQVYRVREGKRGINQKFIIGAKRAFPDCRLDDLFYLEPEPPRPVGGGGVASAFITAPGSTMPASGPGFGKSP